MRVSVRNPFGSARPTRATLLATLFALLTSGLVMIGAVSGDPSAVDIEADLDLDLAAAVKASPDADEQLTTTTGDTTPNEVGNTLPANYAAVAEDEMLFRTSDATDAGGSGDDTVVEEAPVAPKVEAEESADPIGTPLASAREKVVAIEPGDSADTGGEDEVEDDGTVTPATTAASTTTSEDPPVEETTTETTQVDEPVVETTTTAAPSPPPADANGWVDSGNGVMMPPVMLKIRYCESRDRYDAANPASSARGAYQFLTGSWAAYGHKDRYGVNQAHLASPAQQDEAAVITWQADGTRPWNASRSCWG